MAFYKLDNDTVLEGNHVEGDGYVLTENFKDEFIYPIDGWYWFDVREQAYTFFNIELPIQEGIINGYYDI